jgi:ribonuclease BN (tRNA processing enzyme)
VVELGDEQLMFDCGPAATHKLVKAGLFPTPVDHLFFTHHHFDHDVDYPAFLLARGDQSIVPRFRAGGFHHQNPLAFLDALCAGAPPPATLADGRRAVEMILAAYRAAATGRRARVPPPAPSVPAAATEASSAWPAAPGPP